MMKQFVKKIIYYESINFAKVICSKIWETESDMGLNIL